MPFETIPAASKGAVTDLEAGDRTSSGPAASIDWYLAIWDQFCLDRRYMGSGVDLLDHENSELNGSHFEKSNSEYMEDI